MSEEMTSQEENTEEVDHAPTTERVEAEIDQANAEQFEAEDASDSELAEAIDSEDTSEGEKVQAAVELKKRLKIKVDGQEIEEEIDFNDEEKLKEILQKGHASEKRFQEAAGMKKQLAGFVKLMQNDPAKALAELGHDVDGFVEKYMDNRIQELQKSPEQIEREKIQKELEDYRHKAEELELEKHETEKRRMEDQYARQFDQEITDGLKNTQLPKSPYVVKRVAEAMMLSIKTNPDTSVADVLPLVERQIKSEIQQMFEAAPDDVLDKMLGKNVSNRLRQQRLDKMKKAPSKTANSVKATGKSEINKKKEQVEKKPVSARDFFRNL